VLPKAESPASLVFSGASKGRESCILSFSGASKGRESCILFLIGFCALCTPPHMAGDFWSRTVWMEHCTTSPVVQCSKVAALLLHHQHLRIACWLLALTTPSFLASKKRISSNVPHSLWPSYTPPNNPFLPPLLFCFFFCSSSPPMLQAFHCFPFFFFFFSLFSRFLVFFFLCFVTCHWRRNKQLFFIFFSFLNLKNKIGVSCWNFFFPSSCHIRTYSSIT